MLLLGESGTGKEVVARFINRASARSGGPFAAQAKPDNSSSGVLFLDEVGEMSLAAQAKFLRLLQEHEFQRLGGTRTLKANVRVAATNQDLRAAIDAGRSERTCITG